MQHEQQVEAVARVREAASNLLYSESFWIRTAIVTALTILACVLISAVIALCALDPMTRAANVDIIYKLGLIGVGVVTFCTVVWRGLISARQADTQREQIAKLSEQIASTDDNNRAKLLLDGAEMLADSKPEKVAAGIAALQAVASSKAENFAIEAMNLLVEYISDRGENAPNDKNASRAVASINSIAKLTNRRATSPAIFRATDSIYIWERLLGASSVFYERGRFHTDRIDDAAFGKGYIQFMGVRFEGCEIDTSSRIAFRKCHFEECQIRGLNSRDLAGCTFVGCDFSGAVIVNRAHPIPDLRSGGNFYVREKPPTLRGKIIDWREVLLQR